ncbi:MAG TPA: PAS domain S-box protein, partial [Anaeromyxobacteraceae bacterium]|nr:PAS domain S-box protein [Anaeromyxobacteraceae bacterium]
DGRVVEVNEVACAMLGYTRDELRALRVVDIEANEDQAEHEAHRERMQQRGFDRFVSRHRRKDGSIIDVEASVYFVPSSGGRFVSFVRDISERLRSEERLRLSEEEHRFVLENSSDVVYGLSPDGRFTHLSPVVEKILGWKPEEMVNRPVGDFLAPGSLPTALAYVARVASDSLEGRTPPDFHGELEYRSRDGLPVWGEVRAFPKRRPDGSLVEFLGVARDITARKVAEAEKAALQAKLALTSRLAAMGTLVAGVAHEINNPLAAGMASAGLALERLQDVANEVSGGRPSDAGRLARDMREVIADLRTAQGAYARIAQIVRDLSAFARPDTSRKRIRMAELVQQALRWLAPTVGTQATVEVEGLDDAPDVVVSVGQIEQVLVNLITNAAKATRPGERGRIVVRAGTGETGRARIEVIDQGVGIPPELRERIFDPFYTTRPAGQERGAGLGLSICHAIVTDHGGTISVESMVGKGSTFAVELPVAPPTS